MSLRVSVCLLQLLQLLLSVDVASATESSHSKPVHLSHTHVHSHYIYITLTSFTNTKQTGKKNDKKFGFFASLSRSSTLMASLSTCG
jgi:hypothetical protein